MSDIVLYDYWRSSASYRVRIALNLKRLDYRAVSVNLVEGEQTGEDYKAHNPQGRVPALIVDGATLTQSLSILDYLDDTRPEPPFLPPDPAAAAHVRAMAQVVATDIHPLNNLAVLRYLKNTFGVDDAAKDRWYAHWVREGFTGLEALAKRHGGKHLSGDRPGLADICLVPQIYNARRFDITLDDFPKLVEYDAKANALDAFRKAHPDNNK
ncbi:MAG: maleylacetoacetate isomerase [Sphingomonadaceae bacterium]|nr:maleylacetoacetate isomerase [Sphingomonadaceae bacterium]